jgi:DNA-directed RNA polymerase specialized sigma24 family protein
MPHARRVCPGDPALEPADLIQSAYLKVAGRLDESRSEGEQIAYLTRAITQVAIDQRRRLAARVNFAERAGLSPALVATADVAREAIAAVDLAAALATPRRGLAEAVMLGLGYSSEEIGAALGKPVATAVARALRRDPARGGQPGGGRGRQHVPRAAERRRAAGGAARLLLGRERSSARSGIAKDFTARRTPATSAAPSGPRSRGRSCRRRAGRSPSTRPGPTGRSDWAARLIGPKYAGAGLTTVRQVLPRYAPSGDRTTPTPTRATCSPSSSSRRKERPQWPYRSPPSPVNPSPNHGYPGDYRPEAVCWHITAGSGASALSWLTNPASNASANYVITEDGAILRARQPGGGATGRGMGQRPGRSPEHGEPPGRLVGQRGINPNRRTVSIEHAGSRACPADGGAGGRVGAADGLALPALRHRARPRRTSSRTPSSIAINRPNCPGFPAPVAGRRRLLRGRCLRERHRRDGQGVRQRASRPVGGGRQRPRDRAGGDGNRRRRPQT